MGGVIQSMLYEVLGSIKASIRSNSSSYIDADVYKQWSAWLKLQNFELGRSQALCFSWSATYGRSTFLIFFLFRRHFSWYVTGQSGQDHKHSVTCPQHHLGNHCHQPDCDWRFFEDIV